MAGEVKACRDAVAALLDEIETYTRVWTRMPKTISTSCEVAVLMGTGCHYHAGTSLAARKGWFILKTWIPLGGDLDDIDDTIVELWDLQIDKFNSDIKLSGTASRSNLERYVTGYERVAGKSCRTITSYLEYYLVKAEAYA